MKKSIIALAVTAASMAGVAQADQTTLYGSVRMAVQYQNGDYGDVGKPNGTINDTYNINEKGSTKVANAGTRWGIKGSNDLGNGLKAEYRFEWAVNANSDKSNQTGRLGWVALSGGFGTVKLGRQWSPYYDVAGYNDLFNDMYYEDYMGVFRTGNTLGYATPNFGGFQLKAAVLADGADGNDEYVDGYNIAAIYDNNGIFAGLTYLSSNGVEPDEDTLLGATIGYSNDIFRLGLVVEREDNGGDTNPLGFNLAGEYYITDMDLVRAGVTVTDRDIKGIDDKIEAAVGYEHKFSKRTRVWAEYGYRDSGLDNQDTHGRLSLGMRTDF